MSALLTLSLTLLQALRRHQRTLLKTASYYCVHITVAIGVAYAVTGDILVAMTLSLLEPTVQMFFFFVHEKLWEKKARVQQQVRRILPLCVADAACQHAQTCSHHCALRTI